MAIPAESTILDVEYVSIRKACEMLGVGYRFVRRLADEGKIGRFDLPGMPIRLVKADVERLAKDAIVPARVA